MVLPKKRQRGKRPPCIRKDAGCARERTAKKDSAVDALPTPRGNEETEAVCACRLSSSVLSEWVSDVEQNLVAMACRLLPHVAVKTNTSFLYVANRGATPMSTPVLSEDDGRDEEELEAAQRRRGGREAHDSMFQRLRGTVAAACALGHRACQVLWGPEGCGKSRLLRLIADDSRKRANTLVFFLDGGVLRSEEMGLRVMAEQLLRFLRSPASEKIRSENVLIRSGSFEFGLIFNFPEKLSGAQVSDKQTMGAMGATDKVLLGEESDDEALLCVSHASPHLSTAGAGNALPYLHSILLLLLQHRVNILVCIKKVENFGVWCDQLLYVLAGLLHDAGSEKEGEGHGGLLFLLTSAAPDMRQLEKRLSSRLTPESQHIPLLQWTPRRLLRVVLKLIRDVHQCQYEASAILRDEMPETAQEGATEEPSSDLAQVTERRLRTLNEKIKDLSYFFDPHVLYGKIWRFPQNDGSLTRPHTVSGVGSSPFSSKSAVRGCPSGSNERKRKRSDDTDALDSGRDVAGFGGTQRVASETEEESYAPLHAPDTTSNTAECNSLYSNHLFGADLVARLCDAALDELNADSIPVSSPHVRENTLSSHLDAYRSDLTRGGEGEDCTASTAVSIASRTLAFLASGALSLLHSSSREKVALEFVQKIKHSSNASSGKGAVECSLLNRRSTLMRLLQVYTTYPMEEAGGVSSRRTSQRKLHSLLAKGGVNPSLQSVFFFVSGLLMPPTVDRTIWDCQTLELYPIHYNGMPLPCTTHDADLSHISHSDDQEGTTRRHSPFGVHSSNAVTSRRRHVSSASRLTEWNRTISKVKPFAVIQAGGTATLPAPPSSVPPLFEIPKSFDVVENGRWVRMGYGSREAFLILCTLALKYASSTAAKEVPARKVDEVLEDVCLPMGKSESGGGEVARKANKAPFRLALAQLHRWKLLSVTAGSHQVQIMGGGVHRVREMLGDLLTNHPEDMCETVLGLSSGEIIYARGLLH